MVAMPPKKSRYWRVGGVPNVEALGARDHQRFPVVVKHVGEQVFLASQDNLLLGHETAELYRRAAAAAGRIEYG
jgi:hypothetical protein